MTPALQFRLLRLTLFFCAFVWGISICGVFLSWNTATTALQGMGAQSIPDDPMLDYWLRMASGAFALVGTGYFLLALNPRKFAVMLPWFGSIMLIEGVILLGHGLRLGLGPFPFYGDVAACFLGGAGIFAFRKAAQS